MISTTSVVKNPNSGKGITSFPTNAVGQKRKIKIGVRFTWFIDRKGECSKHILINRNRKLNFIPVII